MNVKSWVNVPGEEDISMRVTQQIKFCLKGKNVWYNEESPELLVSLFTTC